MTSKIKDLFGKVPLAFIWEKAKGLPTHKGFGIGILVYSVVLTWGVIHYKSEFNSLVRSGRLEAANQIETQKTQLLAKIGFLEDALQRSERFTQKLESSIGIESGKLDKGVGPLSEQEDLAEFLKRVHRMPKAGTLALQEDWRNGKLEQDFYGKLNSKLDEMTEFASLLEGRVNEVYTATQENQYFWSSTPSQWPVHGWVTSEFGMRYNPFGGYRFHEGVDIAAPVGTIITAPSDGIVITSKYMGGYGNAVVIDHGYGITTKYAHASELFVIEGQKVMQGQKIAAVGSTGSSTGPHLHYEVKIDGIPTDPINYIFKK